MTARVPLSSPNVLAQEMARVVYDKAMPECVGCRHAGIRSMPIGPRLERFGMTVDVQARLGCRNRRCEWEPTEKQHKLLTKELVVNHKTTLSEIALVEVTEEDIMSALRHWQDELKQALAQELDIGTEVKMIVEIPYGLEDMSYMDSTLVVPPESMT